MLIATAPVDHRTMAQISGFVASLQEPRMAHISVDRFSAALGIKRSSMAELAGVHRNTLRNPASERLQERMRMMIRVITKAATLTGDMSNALYWFRNEPIADYDHKTAARLVSEGHTSAVLAYLRDLENGANG